MGSWCSWPWCRHRTSVHPTGSTLLRVAVAGRKGWARSGSWTWGTALWKQESGTSCQFKGCSDTVKQKTPPPSPPPPAPSFPSNHPHPLFSVALAIQTIYTYKHTYKQFETCKQFVDCKNSDIIYTVISMTKLLPVFYSIAIIIMIVALFPSLEHSHCASVLMWP